jgi:integrase/recombinase XerD
VVSLSASLTTGHIRPDTASRILRKAFDRIGIEGASTHSFRAHCLNANEQQRRPLRIIQEVSGHKSLDILEKYLRCDLNKSGALFPAYLILTPVKKSSVF